MSVVKVTQRATLLALTMAFSTIVLLCSSAHANAEAPVKLLLESQFGAKVNLNESNYCLNSECKPEGAEGSTGPGGFGEFDPKGVAVDNHAGPGEGNIYAADEKDARVQELKPNGEFVLMFGAEVNEMTHGDVCTKEEVEKGVKCTTGTRGARSGAFSGPESVAVDPNDGHVYVADRLANRVDEYTESGQFILMIGKEVNESKTKQFHETGNPHHVTEAEVNVCAAVSGDICQAGSGPATTSTEHGAFNLAQSRAVLAAGGPSDRLYVGDEHRVQEFSPDGVWVQELPLTQISSTAFSQVRALALDQVTGDLYIVYNGSLSPALLSRTVFRFNATDEPMGEIVVAQKEQGASLEIEAMALDSSGRLALAINEEKSTWSGLLLQAATGKLITQFTLLPRGSLGNVTGLSFAIGSVGSGEKMYAASLVRSEIVSYVPEVVAELVTEGFNCKEEAEHETSVTLECEMNGKANPEEVAQTEAWFLWGASQLLSGTEVHTTPKQQVAAGDQLVPLLPGRIAGMSPNQVIYYQLDGDDALVRESEHLSGEELSVTTPIVPAKILGEPAASFVKSSSAVMSSELNPENAQTEYFFEYGSPQALENCIKGVRLESCEGVVATGSLASKRYARLGATLEATSLQPGTEYAYRLSVRAENQSKDETHVSVGKPGVFKTMLAPAPEAMIGPSTAVGTSSAMITGTVNPQGQSSTYAFELGIYAGALTQYGTVVTGSTGAGTSPVEEVLPLSGLQPGTTYAYRIMVRSGYGQMISASSTFTTIGLPSFPVPIVLAQLPTPRISFPKAQTKQTPTQELALALKACAKKPKKKRVACRRNAREKHTTKTKKTHS